MDAVIRHDLNQYGRALQFLTELDLPTRIPDIPPAYHMHLDAFRDELVSAAEAAIQAHMAPGQSKQRRAAAEAYREELRMLARTVVQMARVLERRGHPGISKAFSMPYTRWNHVRFASHLRGMAQNLRSKDTAEAMREIGCPADMAEQLEAGAAKFDEMVNRRWMTVSDRVGATVGLAHHRDRARDCLTMIDAVAWPYFAQDPELRTLWRELCPPSRGLGPREPKRALGGGAARQALSAGETAEVERETEQAGVNVVRRLRKLVGR